MCDKCQDRGFTEENHGLTVILCDCDKAREVAEKEGIPWGVVDDNSDSGTGQANQLPIGELPKWGDVIDDDFEVLKNIPTNFTLKSRGNYDSGNRTGQVDKSLGSADTSQPKRTEKRKAKKTARKGVS